MITALVQINVAPGKINDTAQQLVDVDGVAEVWSVTGEHDLVALLKLRDYEHLAEIVTGYIDSIEAVLRTNTMLAFKVYSKQELEEAWNIGVE